MEEKTHYLVLNRFLSFSLFKIDNHQCKSNIWGWNGFNDFLWHSSKPPQFNFAIAAIFTNPRNTSSFEMPTKEAKEKMEIDPVTEETKISKCSK